MNSLPLYSIRGGIGKLFPLPHVSNATLVACHYDFLALGQRSAVFTARGAWLAYAFLSKNHLACAASADSTADAPEHTDHLVIPGIKVFFVGHKNLGYKNEHYGRGDQTSQRREHQSSENPYMP